MFQRFIYSCYIIIFRGFVKGEQGTDQVCQKGTDQVCQMGTVPLCQKGRSFLFFF